MFAVFMFGRTLEQVWGPKRFLTYYMVTGIGAGLIQLLVIYLRASAVIPPEMFSLIGSVTVGASGGVFGILLAFGMLFPTHNYLLSLSRSPSRQNGSSLGMGCSNWCSGWPIERATTWLTSRTWGECCSG